MRVLVTGGGGFLGQRIVRRFLERGDSVRIFARGDYPDLGALGVECRRGDLSDPDAVYAAVRGCDRVVHAGAKAGVWGPREEYFRTNVLGTANVIAACLRCGVRSLVHTSSPSVVFDGRGQDGIDERAPFPESFLAWYPATKALAERAVLAANGQELATVALRPHLIFGQGDPHLMPRILEQARSGRLRIVGTGRDLVDMTWVDNAADAHILASDRLAPGSAVAGKAYFITNGEPLPIAELINRILRSAGLSPVTRRVPASVAYSAGAILETVWKITGRSGEPPITRFVARQLGTAHWFDISAARHDLGYEPAVSIDEAMERLRVSLQKAG